MQLEATCAPSTIAWLLQRPRPGARRMRPFHQTSSGCSQLYLLPLFDERSGAGCYPDARCSALTCGETASHRMGIWSTGFAMANRVFRIIGCITCGDLCRSVGTDKSSHCRASPFSEPAGIVRLLCRPSHE